MILHPLLGLAALAAAHAPRNLDSAQALRLRDARSVCARDVHCILTEEATEGPFYVEHPLVRSNITEDCDGIAFSLAINVLDVTNCSAASGVFVDIWHADAAGVYSGWASDHLSAQGPPTAFGNPVDSTRWLRGVQATNASGVALFETVWPGWYHGRSTHIHIRIHNGNVTLDHGMLLGAGKTAHTGQLFFSDELVTEVSETREPYKTRRKTLKPMLNGDDGIYVHSKGSEQIVTIQKDGDAFVGTVTVGIDPTADHHEPHGPGRRPPPPHPPLQLLVAAGVFIVVIVWLLCKWFTRRRRATSGYEPLSQEGPEVSEVQERGRAAHESGYGSLQTS